MSEEILVEYNKADISDGIAEPYIYEVLSLVKAWMKEAKLYKYKCLGIHASRLQWKPFLMGGAAWKPLIIIMSEKGVIREIHVFDQRLESFLSRALHVYYRRFKKVDLPKFICRYISNENLESIQASKPIEINYYSRPELVPVHGNWK